MQKLLIFICILCALLCTFSCKKTGTPSNGTDKTDTENTLPITGQITAPETKPGTTPVTSPVTDPETESPTLPVTDPETPPVTEPSTESVTTDKPETSAPEPEKPIAEETYTYTGQQRTDGTPVASVSAGVYFEDISVVLTAPKGGTVYYTTDYEVPTTKSQKYSSAIRLTKNSNASDNTGVKVSVIRAAAFDAQGKQIGLTATFSYIFPADKNRFTTNVISLVTPQDGLYGYENGILVSGKLAAENDGTWPKNNYDARGSAWERAASFEMFTADGDLAVWQNVGIRVNGNGSRSKDLKSLKVYCRKSYTPDTGKLKYPLLDGLISPVTGNLVTEFDTFILRSGASNEGNTIYTNPLVYDLSQNCDSLISPHFRPVAVFLDGEYYGFMMLTEDTDPTFLANYYGVNEDMVSTINYTVVHLPTTDILGAVVDDGDAAQLDEWNRVKDFIRNNDMANAANYAEAGKWLDLQNFSQYMALEAYVDAWDWPRNNVRVWRYYGEDYNSSKADGLDGKWRFILKDMDIALAVCADRDKNYISHYYTDFFYVIEKDGDVFNFNSMFWSLMNNSDFKKMFLNDVCNLMSVAFSEEALMNRISQMQVSYAKEMNIYFKASGVETAAVWDFNIERMRQFALHRAEYVIEDIKDRLGITLIPVKVKATPGGSIRIGQTTLSLDKDITLYMIKDTVTAYTVTPDAGYAFNSLTGTGSATIDLNKKTIKATGTTAVLTVSFTKTGNTVTQMANLCINEIGFASSHAVNGGDWIELYNPTSSVISLKGMKITQGTKTMTLSDIRVPSRGYTLLLCDGTGTGRHMNFKIARGDTITLTDAAGKTLDSMKISCTDSNQHIGRFPDGGTVTLLTDADLTPFEANTYTAYDPAVIPDEYKNVYLLNGTLFDPTVSVNNGYVSRSVLIRAFGNITAATNFINSFGGSGTTIKWADFLKAFPGSKYYDPVSGTNILYLQ